MRGCCVVTVLFCAFALCVGEVEDTNTTASTQLKSDVEVVSQRLSSVLGLVERMLVQSNAPENDPQQEVDVDGVRAVRTLLQKFESEILAQAQQHDPSRVIAEWNSVLADVQLRLNASTTQLIRDTELWTTLNQNMPMLEAVRDHHNATLEQLQHSKAVITENYNTLRTQLHDQSEQHVIPSISKAETILSHLSSVFGAIPDVSAAASVASSLLQLEVLQQDVGTDQYCSSLLKSILDDSQSNGFQPHMTSNVIFGHLTVPLAFQTGDETKLASPIAKAIATSLSQTTGESVDVPDVQLRDGGNSVIFVRFVATALRSLPASLLQPQEFDLTEKIVGSLARDIAAEQLTMISKHRVQVSSVKIMPTAFALEDVPELSADASLCNLVKKYTTAQGDAFAANRKIELSVELSTDSDNDKLKAKVLDSLASLYITPSSVDISEGSLDGMFGSGASGLSLCDHTDGQPLTSRGIVEAAESSTVCARRCVSNSLCVGYAYSAASSCVLFVRGESPALVSVTVTNPRFLLSRAAEKIENYFVSPAGYADALATAGACAQKCLSRCGCVSVALNTTAHRCVMSSELRSNAHAISRTVPNHVTLQVIVDANDFPATSSLCDFNTWKHVVGSAGSVTALSGIFDLIRRGASGLQSQPSLICNHVTSPPVQGIEASLNATVLKADTTAFSAFPSGKQGAKISAEIRLPLEYSTNWVQLHGSDFRLAVADVIGLSREQIQIVRVRSGSVIVEFTVDVSAQQANGIASRLAVAVINGGLQTTLQSRGLPSAWVLLSKYPVATLQCSDTFLSMAGRLICSTTGSTVTSHVTQPCECSVATQVAGHTHFTFDLLSSTCRSFTPITDAHACSISNDGVDVNFFSGRLLYASRRLFSKISAGRLTGVSTQHRTNEKDAECCANQCLHRDWCVSFDWNSGSQLCDLHNTTIDSAGAVLEASAGTVHYEYTGYDSSLPIDRDETKAHIQDLTQALMANLREVGSYLNKVVVSKDVAFEQQLSSVDRDIAEATAKLNLAYSNVTTAQEQMQQLANDIQQLTVTTTNLTTLLDSKTQERDRQLAGMYEESDQWQRELATVRELRGLVENFLTIDDTEQSRALKWLSHKSDMADTSTIWKPFHNNAMALYTADGLPRNKISPDDTRLTGFIDCTGSEHGVVYSFMAEAEITYTVRLYTKGYSLSDPVLLIRKAPSLQIVADQMVEGATVRELGVGTEKQGMVNLEDALPRYTIRYECKESGWHVIEVTSFDKSACGSFGLSIVSSAPPFVLVVDGQTVQSAITCDSTSHAAVFSIDAVKDITYSITAFSKDPAFNVAGTVLFVRDTSSAYSAASTPSLQNLTESKLQWTCNHNGRFEVRVTPGDGVACGTFGIHVVTLNACARNACPRGTVCEDLPISGQFTCRQPIPHETVKVPKVESPYGFTTTLWLNATMTQTFAVTHSSRILSAFTHSIRLALPPTSFDLTAVREDAGGVAVTLVVSVNSGSDAVAASQQVIASVLAGSMAADMQHLGVPVQSVWLLSCDVSDALPEASHVSVKLDVIGLSDVALRSGTISSILKSSILASVGLLEGVTLNILEITIPQSNNTLLDNTTTATNTTTTATNSTTLLISTSTQQQQHAYISLNITTPSLLASIYIARSLRASNLRDFINDALIADGLSQRILSSVVNATSLDAMLSMKNQLERCSDVDRCQGCEVLWSESVASWVPLQNSTDQCNWISSVGQCMSLEGGALLPCQHLTSELELQAIQAQLVVRLRIGGAPAASLSPHLVRAAMWAANLNDISSIAVLNLHHDEASLNATATLAIGLPSRDAGVMMLAHITNAVLSGDMLRFLATTGPVSSVEILEARLSNAAKTGVRFDLPTSAGVGRHGQCERVTIDTGGCDAVFNLTAPYALATHVPYDSPDGSISVPAPCDVGKNYPDAPFPENSNTRTVIYMDARHVDLERAVPHLIVALPSATAPQSAIALTHTPEQWRATLVTKSFLIIPKTKGTAQASVFDPEHSAMMVEFVQRGGHVILIGSPLRAVSLINQLFETSLKDVSPADGGVSFMPGTNQMHPEADVAHSVLGRCTSNWSDQNAFNFVRRESLPVGARPLYVAGASDSNKVAVFDYTPAGAKGSVVYFGFDFYDVPSQDTACVLRHVMALETQSA
eukprot:c12904_g1_i1.p1 GENE.c12904_g1_i1~~c12904_g1_i1.p1  ORF type:complete len:2169 (+),score=655.66 c12904_g1_i1:59-6508(+)